MMCMLVSQLDMCDFAPIKIARYCCEMFRNDDDSIFFLVAVSAAEECKHGIVESFQIQLDNISELNPDWVRALEGGREAGIAENCDQISANYLALLHVTGLISCSR